MNRTKIDWPGLAYSWNPIVGCANGCPYCYAKKLNDRFKMIPDWTKPMFFENRLDEPLKVKKPATIFVGSMCDIFSIGVRAEWVYATIGTMVLAQQHTFMLLTKRPLNYFLYEWPTNCWLGTTLDHKEHESRLDALKLMSNKRFLSIEPILSDMPFDFSAFELLIIGADSSGKNPPKREWIDNIKHPNIWYKQNIIKYFPDLKNTP